MENLMLTNGKTLTIGRMCMKSLPCKHCCTIDGEEQILLGSDICQLLETNNLRVPDHFCGYKKELSDDGTELDAEKKTRN
jgi:hypothetical protein